MNPEIKLKIYTTTVKSDEKVSFKLPNQYSKDDILAIDTYRIKDGYFVKKMNSNNIHIHQLENKLIIANKSSFNGSFIDNGKLGLVGSDKFYVLGNDLYKIKNLLDTNLGEIIAHYTKYRQDFLDKDAFLYIIDVRNISEIDLPIINNEYLYKYFELSEDEIKL